MKRFRENRLLRWICVLQALGVVTLIYLYASKSGIIEESYGKTTANQIHSRTTGTSKMDSSSIPVPPEYSIEKAISNLPSKLLFSKLFHGSMGDLNLVPYFWRAKTGFDKNMITITTMITEERINRLEMLVNSYSGPISVTFHLPNNFPDPLKVFQSLESFYSSHPKVQAQVDLHVLRDAYSRQFNLWRNIARFFARTEYIFNIDADFKPSKELNNFIPHDPKQILIVPAFEVVSNITIPETKESLEFLWRHGKATQFHAKFLAGHNATMYEKWFDSDTPYSVTQYHLSYEPYWIMHRDALVWCDERFVGYGANKAACIFEFYSAKFPLIVLPDIFLVHMEHPYPEATREMERRYNRRLYDHFRVELCMKYKRKSHPENIETLLEDKRDCLIETARPLAKNIKKTQDFESSKKAKVKSEFGFMDYSQNDSLNHS